MADPQNANTGLWLDFSSSSNNPFLRNSIASTSPALSPSLPGIRASTLSNAPAISPFDDPPARPLSRNPFLDPALSSLNRPQSTVVIMDTSRDSTSVSNPGSPSPTVDEIFGSLSMDDKPAAAAAKNTLIDTSVSDDSKMHDESQPTTNPSSGTTADGASKRPGPASGSVGRPPGSRPPRDAPTNLALDSKPLTDEEMAKLMQWREEERRKASKQRHAERLDRHKPRKTRRIDLIDELDCTGIYKVHHDGPFDAVTKSRNRGRRAPMEAFPEGSLNNTIGGSGPLNARPDHSTFMGHADEEAFKDFASSGKIYDNRPEVVLDPTSRGSIVHGDQSIGLGTSTFLEGTPAPAAAIQKKNLEEALDEGMGLQRKKSLAQRIRYIKGGGPSSSSYGPLGRPANPEVGYRRLTPDGGVSRSAHARVNDDDPFANEFSRRDSDDNLDVVKPASPPLESPADTFNGGGRDLERRGTGDTLDDGQSKPSGGLLSRMKSLKGSRRRPSDAQGQPLPGSAV